MDEIIKIKCPHCSAMLKVKNQPNLEKASITCPVCKQRSPFTAFLPAQNKPASAAEDTQLPGANSGDAESKTQFRPAGNAAIGELVEQNGKRWPLHEGLNTIGRKPLQSAPLAEIAIEDPGKKMSRKHAKIEAVRLLDGSIKHILSNWENANPTLVGGVALAQEDRVVLHNGTLLRLGETDVRFVIQDADETQMLG